MSYNNPEIPAEVGHSRQSRMAQHAAHALGTRPQGESPELVLPGGADPNLYRDRDRESEEREEDEDEVDYEDEEIDPYWSTVKICAWILQTDPWGVEVSRGFARKDAGQQRSGNGSPVSQTPVSTEVKDDSLFWIQERFAKLGVKGSFLPLSVQPKNVGLADWLAHKCSEEYRVLEALIKILQERNQKNNNLQICNPQCCPSMSAGKNYTYTWLNSSKEPVKVPAIQYISLVQRWIVGKLSDPRVFPCEPLTATAATYASGGLDTAHANTPIPAGPTNLVASVQELSGRNWVGKDTNFPENFVTDVKTIFRQMFRIYAHIYHSHWVEPFWHLSGSSEKAVGWTDLNSAFCNFVITAKLFVLLSEKDIEPMQRLVDIWASNGTIPKEALQGMYDVNAVQAKLRAPSAGATGPAAAPAAA